MIAVRALPVLAAALMAGCGEDKAADKPQTGDPAAAIKDAGQVIASDFPPAGGRTLQQIGDTVPPRGAVGLATSELTPGRNRLAFGLIDVKNNRFIHGKSAVYVARSANAPARGPFPAPADPVEVAPKFRSKANANTAGVRAIYEADAVFGKPGRYYVLVLTRRAQGITGAATQVGVGRSSHIPAVGERPPAISTDTVAVAGGDIARVDTRQPPDDMHRVNFRRVLGRKPVALLFATPALCQSRVCGPVTDVAAQLEQQYRGRITFIHQEVYRDNQVQKGLRAPLRKFGLHTEPWLFTFNRRGVLAARLEGAFGNGAFKRALDAALR